MTANAELNRTREWQAVRGFGNLFRKENRAWWSTNRWWVNAVLWITILCGLTAVLLFAQNYEVVEAAQTEIDAVGGVDAYTVMISTDVFFQFGVSVLSIGTVVLMLDSIIGERQSGETAWLLSKPVSRRAYILSKLSANLLAVLILIIGTPSLVGYALFSIRMGGAIEPAPFLAGVGLMTVHVVFYLTLVIMLGTFFKSRGPILGIALGSLLGGGMIGGMIQPLFYITPWMLPKMASMLANGQAVPPEIGYSPVVATSLWCLVFILVSFGKFERTEL